MNITENLKTTLNKTLEIALGIEKINSIINPQKAHTDGEDIINAVYKASQALSTQAKAHTGFFLKNKPISNLRSTITQKEKKAKAVPLDLKKQLALSIKSITQRVKLSRAGKRTVGSVLGDEFLPFNKSIDKAINSRVNTPKPTSLPFVSLTTGKTENPMKLPNFSEYLENKGSNYLKLKLSEELIGRFDRATLGIKKFTDEFDSKVVLYNKSLEESSKRQNFLRKPSFIKNESQRNSIVTRSIGIKNFSFFSNSPKRTSRARFSKTQIGFEESAHDFNLTKMKENQKLLDILNKIDLERPITLRQKVKLIQNDKERYKNDLHSLKKFEKFRLRVESNRKKRQSINQKQGLAYLNIIEGFRAQRYKPSPGELEILDF